MQDEEGFSRPSIDMNVCIDCGSCKSVCPANDSQNDKADAAIGYLLQSLSVDNVKTSSSGGAFVDIAKAFLDGFDKVAIFGVALDEKLEAKFSCVTSANSISLFSGSKYVQANIDNSFVRIKEYLRKGYRVVFAGTPCQVDGLKHYLNIDDDSLLCIDLICHGVGSPKVFERYLSSLEQKYNSKIIDYRFTMKRPGWLSKRVVAQFDNGKEYSRMAITLDDPYMTAYLSHCIMRPSCYSCRYTNLRRTGDITIGDAWGVEKRRDYQ